MHFLVIYYYYTYSFIFFFKQKPGEPVYAQVNRDKKRSRQYEGSSGQDMGLTGTYDEAPSLSRLNMDPHGQGAGDSWV
jgi:hypothetical protein